MNHHHDKPPNPQTSPVADITIDEVDPGPTPLPSGTSSFRFRADLSNIVQNDTTGQNPTTGTRTNHPARVGNKRSAEVTLENKERIRRRSNSATMALESYLLNALQTAQAIGHATPSNTTLNLLTQLTDYFNIKTTTTSNTGEIEGVKQELATLKTMLTALTAAPSSSSLPNVNSAANPSNGPNTSFATGPVIRPQKRTRTKANPMRRNHPSRLVVEVAEALDVKQRPSPMVARDQINTILKSNVDTKDLRVVGVKFNTKGNCVAIAHPNTPIEKLITHVDKFAKVVAGNSAINAHPDTKWAHVVLNRVDTGQVHTGRPWTRNELAEEFGQALVSEGITTLVGQPRWMAHPDVLKTKRHASVVITLRSQDDADKLLYETGGLMVFGDFVKTGRYTDKRPLKQCKLCWRYDHFQQTCKQEGPTCRLCSGPHHERSHKCQQCDKRDCQHIPLKCVNCDEAHPSDYSQCNARRTVVGSERTTPHAIAGGRRTITKESTAETNNNSMEL